MAFIIEYPFDICEGKRHIIKVAVMLLIFLFRYGYTGMSELTDNSLLLCMKLLDDLFFLRIVYISDSPLLRLMLSVILCIAKTDTMHPRRTLIKPSPKFSSISLIFILVSYILPLETCISAFIPAIIT